MKTIAIILVVTLLIGSCSSEDNNISPDENLIELEVNLNPPDWIQGTWLDESSKSEFGWKFTTDNAIWIIDGSEDFNLKEKATRELNNWDFLNSQDDVIVEHITDMSYRITTKKYMPYSEFTYYFVKINENSTEWRTAPDPINPLLLLKQ